VTEQLPGWEEGLIKRLCVVFDPHNILPAMFRDKTFQLHYIESIEDLVWSQKKIVAPWYIRLAKCLPLLGDCVLWRVFELHTYTSS
jgi:hypothetical protein